MRIAAVAVAAAVLALGVGCTSTAPYQPPRELVDAIPREMAKDALRDANSAFEQAEKGRSQRTITFTDMGFTVEALYTAEDWGYSVEVTYNATTWSAFTHDYEDGWSGLRFPNAEVQPIGNVGWKRIDKAWIFAFPKDDVEPFLRTLDALTSLGIKKALD